MSLITGRNSIKLGKYNVLPASFRAGASGGGSSGEHSRAANGGRGGRSRASVYSGDDGSRLLLLVSVCTLL